MGGLMHTGVLRAGKTQTSFYEENNGYQAEKAKAWTGDKAKT
jgi:hypothetical protein